MHKKEKERWKALLFIYMFMMVFVIIFQGMPPIFGHLISEVGISYAQAGALMSLFGLPGIFLSIPGGILSDIYGSKKTGMLALLIAFFGALIVGFSNTYPALLFGRIVSGIGALTISIIAPQVLSLWFDRSEMGIAMGIFNTAMPFGTIITLNSFGLLAGLFSWKFPVLVGSFYALVIFMLFYFRYPVSSKEKEQMGKGSFQEAVKELKHTGLAIWLLAIIWMLYNASSISYLSFGGAYYVSMGYDEAYAGFLTSLLMIGALLLSPFVGYLTDRVGRQEYFIMAGGGLFAFSLFLIARTSINPVLLGLLIGLAASLVPAPLFALVPKFLPPRQMGLGYGILASCLNVGVLLGPFLVGLLYDKSLNYGPGFNLMIILALAMIGVALYLMKVQREGN